VKVLLKLLVIVLVLVVVAGVAAFIYIDRIAKAAIERGSTTALGVQTTLGSASVKLFQGGLSLNKLNVANPQGFKSTHFLTLGAGDVTVTLGSLRHDVVKVPSLKLEGVDINLEKGPDKANYQVILANLKKNQAGEGQPPEPKAAKRYIINRLDISNVKVHVNLLGVPGSDLDLPIDRIELQNVGSETGKGVLLRELAGVIVQALLAAVVEKAGAIIPGDIAAELKNGLGQLQDLSKLADVKELGRAAGELAKPVEQIRKVCWAGRRSRNERPNHLESVAALCTPLKFAILTGNSPRKSMIFPRKFGFFIAFGLRLSYF
jgi:uncharacterized protein involved in outer membrane biogenesis